MEPYDGLYEKYRVFKEPDNDYEEGHPVPVIGPHFLPDEYGDAIELEEVTTFVFVLKPDTDHHARVALAAYAASCHQDRPQLSDDLMRLLSGFGL